MRKPILFKTVNLRDLPEDFVRAKAYAALSGLTLRDFMIQSVEAAMENEIRAVYLGGKIKSSKFRPSTKKIDVAATGCSVGGNRRCLNVST